MTDFFKIHDQFHANKRATSPIILPAGPFTCYLNPKSPAHYENYAVPHMRKPEKAKGGIEQLVEVFTEHTRNPRLEYIEACAPGLETALVQAGFRTESRSLLMICEPESLLERPAPAGCTLSVLDETGDLETYRQFKTVEKRSFGASDSAEATDEEAEASRDRFGKMKKVVAELDGKVVGIGTLTFEHNGVAEAAGIATLPGYRGRGIATAVTVELCREGFRSGLDYIFLTAADEAAGRVYLRAGFLQTGTVQINISLPGQAVF